MSSVMPMSWILSSANGKYLQDLVSCRCRFECDKSTCHVTLLSLLLVELFFSEKQACICIWRDSSTLKLCHLMTHYCEVTWASGRIKSPTTRLFVQGLVQANSKGNMKILDYPPFVRVFHCWQMDSHHKGSIMQKTILWHWVLHVQR